MHTLILFFLLSLSLSTMSEIKKGCTKSLNLFCCLLYFNARINHHHHVSLLLFSLSPSLCPHHPLPFRSQPPHKPKGTIITSTTHKQKKQGQDLTSLSLSETCIASTIKKVTSTIIICTPHYHHFLLLYELGFVLI
jgi:hypothetical protein